MVAPENPALTSVLFPSQAEPETLAQEKERVWREGFEAMGRDPDMDVEYMLPAAREVLFGS